MVARRSSQLSTEICFVLPHIIIYFISIMLELNCQYCCTIELLFSWWYFYVKHMPGNIFILPNQLWYPVSSHFEAPRSCYTPLLVTQAQPFKSFCHVGFDCFVRTRGKKNPLNLTQVNRETNNTYYRSKQPRVWIIGKLVCFGTSHFLLRSACFESNSRFCMLN